MSAENGPPGGTASQTPAAASREPSRRFYRVTC